MRNLVYSHNLHNHCGPITRPPGKDAHGRSRPPNKPATGRAALKGTGQQGAVHSRKKQKTHKALSPMKYKSGAYVRPIPFDRAREAPGLHAMTGAQKTPCTKRILCQRTQRIASPQLTTTVPKLIALNTDVLQLGVDSVFSTIKTVSTQPRSTRDTKLHCLRRGGIQEGPGPVFGRGQDALISHHRVILL